MSFGEYHEEYHKSLKLVARRDHLFNELYVVVSEEYGNWDEGRTVDWDRVEVTILLLLSTLGLIKGAEIET